MSHPIPIPRDQITAILLAGGEGRRLGGRDKGLVPFHGRPLVETVLERLAPQVGGVVISANRNLELYGAYGRPVVSDGNDGFLGPLAGVTAALAVVETPYALLAPCDVPLLPEDLAARLAAGIGDAEVALPDDGEHRQHAFALLKSGLRPRFSACLEEGRRGLGRCFATLRTVTVDFSDRAQAFRNLNTDEELAALESAGMR